MKNNTFDNFNHINDYMNSLQTSMIEQTNNVSNKEALKDKIHEIHNYLRNNGAGYGMNALKVFNLLYGLKKIEENNLLDKINLKKPECEFSYLLKLANQHEDELLAGTIFQDVLDSINESEIKELLFYEIPKKIKSAVFSYLIKEIDKISIIEQTCNVLLSGKIYEYFIGRDESAISELGAYFTDRHIVDYILSKLNPSINPDGSISSMIDMFGGSGGFTTGYINFLNQKYPQEINWTSEINKISHFDMNEDVIKSAGLEFFCLTGVLPNMDNLKYKNSFTDEFNNMKYKYPLTNPPYGGDKNKISESQNKRNKVRDYIKNELLTITDEELRIKRQKQLKKIDAQEKQDKIQIDKGNVSVSTCSSRIQKFAKINNLKGKDKESCSLMLLMDIVEFGGTAIGVLKEGVFFNKTYKNLRKCLIEKFNVREIISIPQDQFENTSTKTSIIIFDNIEQKTTEIKFSDLVIERYTEDKFAEVFGDIVIIENKNDIKNVRDVVVSHATKAEILNQSFFSLNGKEYNKKELNIGKGYELVKLGSICKSINKKCTLEDKIYNYVEISNITNNILNDYVVYNKNELPNNASNKAKCGNILISCVRPKPSKILLINENFKELDNFVFSSALANIELNNTNISYYIYAILYILSENFEKNLCNGSSYPRFSPKQLENLQIPIPKSESKIQEWVDKISNLYNDKIKKQEKIKELETFIQNKIKDICENEDCDEVELGNICEIMYGKRITQNKNKGTKYTAFGGGNIMSYKVDEYNRDGLTYKISRDGLSLHNCVMKIYGKIFLNDTAFSLNSKILDITNNYIGEFLLDKKEYIYKNCSHGSAQLHINLNKFMKIKIQLPKNKQLIQDLEITFKEIEHLQNETKVAEELYHKLLKELSNEAIPIPSENESVNEHVNESVNEPVNKSVNKSVNEPVNKSVNKSVTEPVNESVNEKTNEQIDKLEKNKVHKIKIIKKRIKQS